MSNLHLKADLELSKGKYFVGLSLVEFMEDNVTIIYSPALDLSGYGYNHSEARHSFFETMHEFFRYTTNKNTLETILKDLGWVISGSKKKPKYDPPTDSELVSSNPVFNEIVNNKNYAVSRENVEFAY